MSVGPFPDRPRIGITSWKRAVRTLVGDPEDLFTLAEEYVDGVRRAGGLPFILPPAPLSAAPETVRSLDGLLLTGGGDFAPSCYTTADEGVSSDIDPEEDAWDIALTVAARGGRGPAGGDLPGDAGAEPRARGHARAGHLRAPEPPADTGHSRTCGGLPPPGDDRARKPPRAHPRRHRARGEQHPPSGGWNGSATGSSRSRTPPTERSRGSSTAATMAATRTGAGPEADGWFALAVQWHPERMEHGVDQHIFEDLVERAGTRRAALSRSESR